MTAEEVVAAFDGGPLPLYLTEWGAIRSVIPFAGVRYPTVAMASLIGLPVGGYRLGWDGCMALGMSHDEAKRLLRALNGSEVSLLRDQLVRISTKTKGGV